MNRSFRVGKSFIIFIVLLPFMTVVSIFLYNEYVKTKDDIFTIIQDHLIHEKLQLFKNYSSYITKKHGADIKKR